MVALVLIGSHRDGSYSRKVAEAIAGMLEDARLGPPLQALPYFSQDLEPAPPAAVSRLRAAVGAADTVIIVTPEYNGTVPGVLANTLDWLSRPYRAGALSGKPVIAVAVSPGSRGGHGALAALCSVLDNVGATTVSTAAIAHVDALMAADAPREALTVHLGHVAELAAQDVAAA